MLSPDPRPYGRGDFMSTYEEFVTVQEPLFREVFWHEYAKISRVACKNPIAEGDFCWIFARNCEGTEQLQEFMVIIAIASLIVSILNLTHKK